MRNIFLAIAVCFLFVGQALGQCSTQFRSYGFRQRTFHKPAVKVKHFTVGQRAAHFMQDYFDLNNAVYVGGYGPGGAQVANGYGQVGAGLSYNALLGTYQSQQIDVSRLLHAAEDYLKRSQANSHRGFESLLSITRQVTAAQAEAATAGARLKLAEQRLKLLDRLLKTLERLGSDSLTRPMVQPKKVKKKISKVAPKRAPKEGAALVQLIVTAKCVRCHGNSMPKAGLNLTDLAKLDSRYEPEILRRIKSTDDGERMPPPPADALSPGEIRLFESVKG